MSRKFPFFIAAALVYLSAGVSAQPEDQAFITKPYVQLGYGAQPSLVVTWHAAEQGDWKCQIKTGANDWRDLNKPEVTEIKLPDVSQLDVFTCKVKDLPPGTNFDYRVLKDGKQAFTASSMIPRQGGQTRFVVFGDSGVDGAAQKRVAYQTFQAKPDFVVVAGDLVYQNGRIAEYKRNWFPIYNAEASSDRAGAPLLRSIPFVAAAGNHDIDEGLNRDLVRDLDMHHDGLAYFLFWQHPLNGPDNQAVNCYPKIMGAAHRREAYEKAAGAAYPRMCNFSFDAGNTHWLILDSNPYADWRNEKLRAWIEADLVAAKDAKWRFVSFHHPGFTSDPMFSVDQRMRVLSDLFEKGKVDIVFNGHVHHYERTRPIRFSVDQTVLDKEKKLAGEIPGKIDMDEKWDGDKITKAKGIIYVVTGGGGAALFGTGRQFEPSQWKPFTTRYIANTHSFTVAEASDNKLEVSQMSERGALLDHFTITH